uniref:Uncharacterized protein n=1 Tax=Rhizophora mucronata TaxID=61149 RepID=A0A2P2Q9U5_RHIMU
MAFVLSFQKLPLPVFSSFPASLVSSLQCCSEQSTSELLRHPSAQSDEHGPLPAPQLLDSTMAQTDRLLKQLQDLYQLLKL